MDKYQFNKNKLTERGYKFSHHSSSNREIWYKGENGIEVCFEEQCASLLNEKQYLGMREQFYS
jgi:hypothetical protein